jgi:G:T-mismatch repair DNA endonuclease (very short patch repair protein)
MYGKTFYQAWLDKYGKEIADEKMIQFKTVKKKYLQDNPEHLKKMIVNSHIKRYRKTSIEQKVEDFLLSLDLKFKYNFILNKTYQFDFILLETNTIIETHGDFWHANPLYYSDIDKTKKTIK